MHRASGFLLAAAVGVAGCRTTPGSAFTGAVVVASSSGADVAHDELIRADLARTDSVGTRGLAAGLSALFTEDVIFLRGGLPILRGRSAARAVLSADTLSARATVRWQPVRGDVSSDGKSGYSYGYTFFATPQQAKAVVRVDRYIAFWRKEAVGWRISGYAETYGSPPPTIALPESAQQGMLADVAMTKRGTGVDVIGEADALFSREASRLGTGEAFGRFAASDALIFSGPGDLVMGPEAITASFGTPDGRSSLVWHPVDGEMSASGDLGFTVGNAVFSDQRENAPPLVRYSKYLTVWKKQPDGRWKYVVDGGSPRPKS